MLEINSPIDWTAVGAIATAVQTLAVIVALIYAVRQVKEANKARTISVFLPVYEQINSPESVANRKSLYNDLPHDVKLYSEGHNTLANTIVNQFDFLGYLSANHLADKYLILPLYYGTIIRCWEACLPYITHQRELRKVNFAEYFEFLYRHCLDFIVKNEIPLATYKDEATNNIKKS